MRTLIRMRTVIGVEFSKAFNRKFSACVCVEQKCSFYWRSSCTMTIGIWAHCAIQFRFRSNHSISKSFSIQNGTQFIFMINQQEISLYAIMCLVYEHKSLSSPFCRRVCDHCDVHSGSVPVSRWSNDFSESTQHDWFAHRQIQISISFCHITFPLLDSIFFNALFNTLLPVQALRYRNCDLSHFKAHKHTHTYYFFGLFTIKNHSHTENYKWTVNYFHHLIDLDI